MANFLENWKNKILQSKTVRKTTLLAKRFQIPGFRGLTLYQVLKFIFLGLQKGRITNRAAAISFRIMLAIPPLLIVMLSLIPFIPVENFQENLLLYISKAMPESAFGLVEETLNNLVSKKQQTLISLSFLLALIYSSNSFQAILDGFSYSYNIEKPQSLLVQYLRSFALMLMVSLMVIIGMALITFTGPVVDYLTHLKIINDDFVIVIISIVKWLLIVAVFEIGISVLYRAGHTGKWKAFNAGASFATLGLIIVSSLFAYYVNNFGNYNKLYGSVGTLLVAMLWIYFNCIVLLIGFEINTAIERAKFIAVKDLEPDDVLR